MVERKKSSILSRHKTPQCSHPSQIVHSGCKKKTPWPILDNTGSDMEEQTPNYKLRVTETCTSTGLTKCALNLGLNPRSSYVF
jgi:hypothetical protein